jgi:hypothetical protein
MPARNLPPRKISLAQTTHIACAALLCSLSIIVRAHATPVAFQPFPNNATHSATAVAQAISNVPTNAAVVYDALGQTNHIQVYNFGSLVYTGPINVALTLERVRRGEWMSTESNDGGFFNFQSGELPNIPRLGNNYYMEFVVWFSISLTNNTYDPAVKAYGTVTFPGPMRLLIGLGGEVYFTGDHYGSGLQNDAYFVSPAPASDAFRITGIAREGKDIRVTWPTVGGRTNIVQASSGSLGGGLNFTDLSPMLLRAAAISP